MLVKKGGVSEYGEYVLYLTLLRVVVLRGQLEKPAFKRKKNAFGTGGKEAYGGKNFPEHGKGRGVLARKKRRKRRGGSGNGVS